VLTLLSFPLPPVSLLGLFWSFSAPIVALGVYASRFPRTRIHAGFGARLGLLAGLAITIASLTLNTLGLVLARFAFHDAASIDSPVAQIFNQLRVSMLAKSDTDASQFLAWLTIPEFRVGLLLISVGMMMVFYLVYCSLAGAFGGYLRSRRAPQP